MKKLLIIATLAAALSLPAFAQTETINIWASGDSTADSVTLNYMGTDATGNAVYGFNDVGTGTYVSEKFVTSTGTVTMQLNELEYDVDPSVRFAFGVNNPDGATGTSTYSFTFQTPTVQTPDFLPAGLYNVSSSITGGVTQGDTDPSGAPVVVSPPSSGDGYLMQNFIGTSSDVGGKQDAGVDLVNSSISDPSSDFSAANGYSQPFGPYNATGTFNLVNSASQLSVTTAFGLSNGDSASFTGAFTVSAAPEPSCLSLGLIALAAFTVLAVRARRGGAKGI